MDKALSKDAYWAPDEKSFCTPSKTEINLSTGCTTSKYRFRSEKNRIMLTTDINSPQPKINWYADSFHFVVVEGDIEKEKKRHNQSY